MGYCPQCGGFIGDDTAVCRECGTAPMHASRAALPHDRSHDAHRPQTRSRKLTFSAILCMATGVTAFVPLVAVCVAAVKELENETQSLSGDLISVAGVLSIPGLALAGLSFVGGLCILRRTRWNLALAATIAATVLLPGILQISYLLINAEFDLPMVYPTVMVPLGLAIGLVTIIFVAGAEREFNRTARQS